MSGLFSFSVESSSESETLSVELSSESCSPSSELSMFNGFIMGERGFFSSTRGEKNGYRSCEKIILLFLLSFFYGRLIILLLGLETVEDIWAGS